MKPVDEDRVLATLETEIMPPLAVWLQEERQALALKDLSFFHALSELLIQHAIDALRKKNGIEDLAEFGEQIAIKAKGLIIACLNGALPPDYPYILSLLKFKDEQGLGFISLPRRIVPGYLEIISSDVIPIAVASTRENIEQDLKVMAVIYPGD